MSGHTLSGSSLLLCRINTQCFSFSVEIRAANISWSSRQVSGEIWKKSFKKVCGKALCHIAMKEERHGLFVMYQ